MSSRSRRSKPLVFLVEPHILVADYLRRVLNPRHRVRLIAEGELFLDVGSPGHAEPVFVLDKGTLPLPIFRYLESLRSRFRQPKTIVLDDHCSPEEQFRLLSLGVRGMVAYRKVSQKLTLAIAEVANGGLWVEREILTQYVTYSTQGFPRDAGRTLTQREVQVLGLVERRLSNKEIGATLLVSESTVKFHLANIFEKLGVRSRQSAVEAAEVVCSQPQPTPVQQIPQMNASQVSKILVRVKTA